MIIKTTKGDMPIRYGMNALAMFGDMTNKPMNEVMESLNELTKLKISEVLAFVYVGFVDGARVAGEDCKVNDVGDIGDMIDDDPELLAKATTAFIEDSTPEGAEEGDSKKK